MLAAGTTNMIIALGMSRNCNLDNTEVDEGGVARPNGWPTRTIYPGKWLHSDMKNVSYYHTFKFYQTIMEKGGLQ